MNKQEESRSQLLEELKDTTERRRVEDSLRESERRLFTLLSNLPGIAYRCRNDADWTMEFISEGCLRLTGYPVSDLLENRRTSYADIIHPDDRAMVWDEVQRGVSAGRHFEITYRIRTASGEERWVWEQGVAVGAANEAIEGFITDITDRKRAEEEVRELNRELEQRVRDRTSQLEAANQELEAFAYSVSHDLRAPLRHIEGFVELLEKRTAAALDPQSRHYMDTISESAQRMERLIGDLLSFSRTGRQEMLTVPVDLAALVREVIRQLDPDVRGRDVCWHIEDLPVVLGDPALLRQVLVNLVSNALKFTRPRQQAQIAIGCLPGKESEAVIFVRDNGVGFDPVYARRLFGVFQRLHSPEEFEGTGIGLANVRRIISRHGGSTWAEGGLDHGATFYCSLPQAPGKAPSPMTS